MTVPPFGSLAMEGSSFASLLREWSVAGRPMQANDWQVCGRVAEVAKKFIHGKAKGLVESASRRPLLFTFGSDGTPLRATSTFSSVLSGTTRVVRRGGEGTELLLQRGYIVTRDAQGGLASAPLIRDAVPLTSGKATWQLFSATVDVFPHLRVIGHQSICITHGCLIVPSSRRSVGRWRKGRLHTTMSSMAMESTRVRRCWRSSPTGT